MSYLPKLKYRAAVPRVERLPGAGAPLSGKQLDAHLAEVERRTQQQVADAMEEALRPKAVKHENCDGFDPHSW
jgi:hypothetical protein